MSKRVGITDRLIEFGQATFGKKRGWKKQFADGLGVTAQHLDRYLSGGSEPGNKMYFRLIQLGCDIHWLLTGDKMKPSGLMTPVEKDMLAALKKAGYDSAEKLKYLLSPEDLAANIAAAAVREIKARYGAKRKSTNK
ncbi:MAG: helix-turn-helix transcriptional regulator [Ignavibacteriales bacterium]|nr:helix-turn-helix transcriptional regulator [Ignavibacteriales bacterium]